MTKQEAIQAMKNGSKVSHPYFSKGEYVFMEGDTIVSEDEVPHYEFWNIRVGKDWETNWYVYE